MAGADEDPAAHSEPVEDPEITVDDLVKTCPCCNSKMGDLRVYKGANKEKLDNVGRLCQTCSGRNCFHTVYHTPAYLFEDAQKLVERVRCRQLGVAIPQDALGLLHVRSTPLSPSKFQTAMAKCKKCGSRGCQNCSAYFCKSCCVTAYESCLTNGVARSACRVHKLAVVVPRAASGQDSGSTRTTETVARPKRSTRQKSGNDAPAVSVTSRVPDSTAVSHTSLARNANTSKESSSNSTSNLTTPPIASAPGSQRGLANPITAQWTANHTYAQRQKAQVQNHKQELEAIIERKKRTIRLIIYYMANENPLIFEQYSATYPDFQLSQFSELSTALKLTPSSYLDVHTQLSAESVTVSYGAVITAQKDTPVVIRIRQSLIDPLPMNKCIGIDAHLNPVKTKKRTAWGNSDAPNVTFELRP